MKYFKFTDTKTENATLTMVYYNLHTENIKLYVSDSEKVCSVDTDDTKLKVWLDIQPVEMVEITQEEFEALRAESEQYKLEVAWQNKKRYEAMLSGAPYTLDGIDYQISFTADDGNGMAQVKTAFDLGVEATTIHFENGTKMPITTAEFGAFAAWFVAKRNEFFV